MPPGPQLSGEHATMLMRAALDEAARGLAEGEAPIGCVIARPSRSGFEIVARAHNRVTALRRKTAHAEMLALEDGADGVDRASRGCQRWKGRKESRL